MAYHRISVMIRQAMEEEWAYHGTDPGKLPGIANDGLVPQEQPEEHDDEERADNEALVFFSSRERYARVWGSEVLRFPWPDESWEDPYGDSMWDKDAKCVVSTNHCTPQYIPPEEIEVRRDGGWVPIRELGA